MDRDPEIEQPINHKGHLNDIELWSENSEYNYKINIELAKGFLRNKQTIEYLRNSEELLTFIESVINEIKESSTHYLVDLCPNDKMGKLTFRCVTNVFIKNVLYEAYEQIGYNEDFKRYSKNRITKLIDKVELDQDKHVALLEKLNGA